MPIKFRCSACQTKVRVQSEHAGKRIACPSCKQTLTIPAESTIPDNEEGDTISAKKSGLAAATSNASAKKVASPAPAPEKTTFIKFKCPACEKPTGFPSNLANTPASCPLCKAKIMVPSADGEESFVVGGVEPARKASHMKLPKPTRTVDIQAPEPAPAQAVAAGSGDNLKFIVMGTIGLAAVVVLVALLFVFKNKNKNEKDTVAQAVSEKKVTPAEEKVQPAKTQKDLSDKDAAVGVQPQTSGPAKAENQTPPVSQVQEAQAAPPAPTNTAEPALRGADAPPAADAAAAPQKNEQEEVAIAPKATPPENPLDLLSKNSAKKVIGEGDDVDTDAKKPEPNKPATAAAGETNPFMPPEKGPANAANPATPPPGKTANVTPPPAAVVTPPVCALCMGTGFIPLQAPRPYVFLAGMPAPKPIEIVPWRFCTKCQKDKDNKLLVENETSRLAEAPAKHQKWEELTTLKLILAETHHLSIRSQLPQPATKVVATAIEQLARHLQQVTGTTVLTQTLPNTHELLIFGDTLSYNHFIDGMAAQDANKNTDWEMVRKVSAFSSRKSGFFNANRSLNNPEHMPLFLFAKMLMVEATDGKAPPWLSEGFASYCENAVTNKNYCYSFAYELNDVKFGDNWNADIKKFAMQSKLKPWNQIFTMDLVALKPLDYLTCYSMVCFLMKTDPQRFTKFVLEIKAGNDSAKAIEKVFGRKISDIQVMWANWAMTQR